MFDKFKKPEVPGTLKIDEVSMYPHFTLHDSLPKNVVVNVKDDHSTKTKLKVEEKWIWVEGYKGTKSDMTAYDDFQYEIGKEYQMDEDATIKTCSSGFHFCKILADVFGYYKIGNGHRFFKVRALVREKDYEEYGAYGFTNIYTGLYQTNDKLAAKAIILERELTLDEIFYGPKYSDWTEAEKARALLMGCYAVEEERKVAKLVNAGYSEPFAKYISSYGDKVERALAVASQPGLSMDMKVFAIMYDNK